MDAMEVKTRLTQIFRDIFADADLEINERTTSAEVPKWDSLSHVNLIFAVEKGFGIRLTAREMRSVKNVGDFIELIKRKAA